MTDNQDNYTLKEYHERLKSIFKRLNRQYETVVVRASTKKKAHAEASEKMNTEWKTHPPRVTKVPDRRSKSFSTSTSSSNLSFSSTSSSTSSSSSFSHKPSRKIQLGQADFAKKSTPSMKKQSTKPEVKKTRETNPKAKASRPPARHDINKTPPNCKTTFIAAKATGRRSYSRHK
nr:TonB box [Echinococcus granulosus]